MPRKHHISLLVGNPTARTGKAEKAIKKAMKGLADAQLNPEFFATLPEGKTVQALVERLESADVARVIYLGGDGTFAETAKGIILAREKYGIDIPMGMLPMGTANDQGRSFGIMAGERSLAANIRIIAEGVEQWLDAGKVESLDANGQIVSQDLWFDSWGVGLSAQILAARNRDRQLVANVPFLRQIYRDKLLYVGAAVGSYFRSMVTRSRFSAEVTIDGKCTEYTGLTDIVLKGTILYGGDWIFSPDAKADDGKFEVIIMKGHADWASTTIAAHKRNPLTKDDLAVLGLPRREFPSGKTIEIRLFRPKKLSSLYSQMDGEEFPYTDHYRIENLFHYLRIIVPASPRWI